MEALTKCCPSCSGEMQQNKAKMFGHYDWIVCDDCGYRVLDVEDFFTNSGELPDVHIEVKMMTLQEIKETYGIDDTQN